MSLKRLFVASLACALGAGLGAGCGTSPTTDAEEAPAERAAPAAPAAPWSHHGAAFSVAEALPASVVLADPSAHQARPVRVRGELTEVCQRMGCWAVLRDDAGRSVRVTMKDHAFGIAKDSRGHEGDVEGQLVSKPVDPERVAHFAEEGSRTNPEAGKARAWEIVATAVATRPPPGG